MCPYLRAQDDCSCRGSWDIPVPPKEEPEEVCTCAVTSMKLASSRTHSSCSSPCTHPIGTAHSAAHPAKAWHCADAQGVRWQLWDSPGEEPSPHMPGPWHTVSRRSTALSSRSTSRSIAAMSSACTDRLWLLTSSDGTKLYTECWKGLSSSL